MATARHTSAGLLLCRRATSGLEFLLVHPGGPFYANRDEGSWTIPKGLIEPGEDPLDAAKREFVEEIGVAPEADSFEPLGSIIQKSGKVVHAWAFLGDLDPETIRSNHFEMEWPPRSGRVQSFPEVDRAAFFSAEAASRAILPAQRPLLERAVLCFGSE